MRVLIVSVFPPDPAPEASHALHIAENLAASGVEVHVLCKKGSVAATSENIEVHPVIRNWSWSDLPRVTNCIKMCRPDVVLLLYLGWIYDHNPMITFLPTICRKRFNGLPCITQFENVDVDLPHRRLPSRLARNATVAWSGKRDVNEILGTLLRDSAQLIALSSPHRDQLARHDSRIVSKTAIVPPPPLIRRSHGGATAIRNRIRRELGIARDDFVVMYWGYIYPGKGLETLIRAFQLVARNITNARLIIVGGALDFPTEPISCDDYYRMVRQLPEELGIDDKVIWTGHFDWDSDLGSQFLRAGDVCILPFDYGVTLNISTLAAASTHGLPVIGTSLPEKPDEGLEHGRDIYLVEPGNSRSLAGAMRHVAEDHDFSQRLRHGSRRLARNWHSWETTTPRLIEILASAVRDGAPTPEDENQKISLRANYDNCTPPPIGTSEAYPTDPPSPARGQESSGAGDEPLVSVILAVYNVEKFLSQCLDALVHQSLSNIEIVAVNDASTDRSAEILQEYATRHPSIRVVNCLANQGLATVRNIGLCHARGRYVAFADSDDWVDVDMCRRMYLRASRDDADILVGCATVYYDDSKVFAPLFDRHMRQTLDPRIDETVFQVIDHPRVLLMEPVAWTKIYKRSFLDSHRLKFEDGLNSYEDVCFHFSALLKAARISLFDEPLVFYRQNRPGQISGRTSQKVFEVFEVFRRIHANLSNWKVPAEIWAMLFKVEVKQFSWLLGDRVQPCDRTDFAACANEHMRKIPQSGFELFRDDAEPHELEALGNIRNHAGSSRRARTGPENNEPGRQSWRWAVRRLYQRFPTNLNGKPGDLSGDGKSSNARDPGAVNVAPAVTQGTAEAVRPRQLSAHLGRRVTETCQIKDQHVRVCHWPEKSNLAEDLRRIECDYFLSQSAVFREGDVVIDVGAGIGLSAIYLARKFPFITVYALESDSFGFDCLQTNIAINANSNVIAIDKTLSADGTVLATNSFYRADEACAGRAPQSSVRSERKILSETVTLERLFDELEIQQCRMLKIEGLEATAQTLEAFSGSDRIDFLCGEVNLNESSEARLESVSWRIARHFFWRTTAREPGRSVSSWIHHAPTGLMPNAQPLAARPLMSSSAE